LDGEKGHQCLPVAFVSRGQGCHLPAVWPNSPTKGKFLDSALFFGHDPRQSSFRETRKRFIMGVAGFLLGLGLLAFSEMKSVAFLVRKLGSFSGQRKDVSHSRGARNAQS